MLRLGVRSCLGAVLVALSTLSHTVQAQSLCPERAIQKQEGAYQVGSLNFAAPRDSASTALQDTFRKLADLGYQAEEEPDLTVAGQIRMELPPVAKDRSYFDIRWSEGNTTSTDMQVQTRVATHRQQPLAKHGARTLMCYLMGPVMGRYRWDQEPTSYRGIALGVELTEQLQACPPLPKPVYPNLMPGPRPPSGPCYIVYGDGLESHLRNPSVAFNVKVYRLPPIGTQSESMILRLLNGRVEAIYDEHSASDLETLRKLFVKKYGPVHDTFEPEENSVRYQWQGQQVDLDITSNVPKYSRFAKAAANTQVAVPVWAAPIAGIGLGLLGQELDTQVVGVSVNSKTYSAYLAQKRREFQNRRGKPQALDRL